MDRLRYVEGFECVTCMYYAWNITVSTWFCISYALILIVFFLSINTKPWYSYMHIILKVDLFIKDISHFFLSKRYFSPTHKIVHFRGFGSHWCLCHP